MNAPLPKIKGFDRQGEPELRRGENGALELVFNFMPPMTAAGEERSPELFLALPSRAMTAKSFSFRSRSQIPLRSSSRI
jgi:hypothetical protein